MFHYCARRPAFKTFLSRSSTTPAWRHLACYVVPVTFLSFFFNIPMFMNLQRSWMANTLYVKINLWLRVVSVKKNP